MSRFRRFLTFAQKIQHLKKELFRNRASAQGIVWVRQQSIGLFFSVKALLFYAVIPFAIKYYRSELLTGAVLYVTQLG